MSQDARKGYWIERNEKGEPLYCHWYRKNGKKEIVRKTLQEIETAMKLEIDTVRRMTGGKIV